MKEKCKIHFHSFMNTYVSNKERTFKIGEASSTPCKRDWGSLAWGASDNTLKQRGTAGNSVSILI